MPRACHLVLGLVAVAVGSSCGQISDEQSLSPEPAPIKTLQRPASATVAATPPCSLSDGNERYDWPRLFGPHGTNIVAFPGDFTAWPDTGPALLWRKPIGTGYSAPVVQAGKLVLLERIADQERIVCLDAETAEQLWSFSYPTQFASLVADEGAPYSHGPYSTPTIVGDRVFAIGAEARVTCVSLENGELLWTSDLREEFSLEMTNHGSPELYGFSPSPAPFESSIIVNVGGRKSDAGVVAFDQSTGETIWTATSDGASYATPAIAQVGETTVAAVLTRDAFVLLDPTDGQVLFREEFRAKNPDATNATSPIITGDKALACGYGVGSMAVKLKVAPGEPVPSADVLWRNRRTMDSQFTNLIVLDGLAIGYPAARRGVLAGLEVATGETRWQVATGYDYGSSLLINGELIVLTKDGDLLRMTGLPGEPTLTAAIERFLEGPCYTGPIFADGRLYVRTERELVCLRLF